VEPQTPVAAGRNNAWLDLVRALAIVMVLLRHGERALHSEVGGPQNALQTIFMNGWIGVDLFFGLSGYLIARHLLHAGIGSPDFRLGRYFALRALRILPAYFTVLLLVVIGAIPLFEVATDKLGVRVAYHLLFLQDYLPSDINVVFWSLGVEEKFYLVAPVLILLLLKCRTMAGLAAVLLALFTLPTVLRLAIFLSGPANYDYPSFWSTFRSPFHMSLEGLVIGLSIALAQHAGLVRRCRRTGLALLAGSCAGLAIWMSADDFMATINTVDVALQPPLIAMFIGGILFGGVQLAGTPLPFAPISQAIAKLSYSLYLIHFSLIPLAIAIALPFGSGAFWITYLCISVAAASVLYFVVERPFLAWKDQLARRKRPDLAEMAVSKA
jgi:peptidoglycan/LPS O-acetylase OafA/YrhL